MQNKHQNFFLVLGVPTLGEGGGSTWLGQIPKFFQKLDLKAPLTEIPKHWFNSQRVLLVLPDLFRNPKLNLLKFAARAAHYFLACVQKEEKNVFARARF